MTPQLDFDVKQDYQEYAQPDRTYKLNDENISGKIEGLEAVEQAVRHILSTERYSNPIYDDNYGVELEQYVGKDIGYIEADIESTLNEALTQDDRINSVKVDKITQIDSDNCQIDFTVFTKYGNLKEKQNVLQ